MSAGFPNVLCAVVTVDCTLLRCSAALYLTALYTSRSGYYDISNMHINISPWYTHGREWSRDLDTALWFAETDHVTWILYTSRSTMTYQTCTSYLRVPMWEPDPVLHNSRKQWIRFWYYFVFYKMRQTWPRSMQCVRANPLHHPIDLTGDQPPHFHTHVSDLCQTSDA